MSPSREHDRDTSYETFVKTHKTMRCHNPKDTVLKSVPQINSQAVIVTAQFTVQTGVTGICEQTVNSPVRSAIKKHFEYLTDRT
jgi:hypothetical protein